MSLFVHIETFYSFYSMNVRLFKFSVLIYRMNTKVIDVLYTQYLSF